MIDLTRPRLEEFRHWLVQEIPCEPKEARADLAGLSLPSLLINYMNWRDRFVPTRRRNVTTWENFMRDPRTFTSWPAINDLARRIAAGEALTPFLSKDIKRFGYVRPRAGKDGKRRGIEWSDKDYALNSFGFHHLHLSDRILLSGWARRTDALLYVSFNRESAFFLMVGDHKSFDDGTLEKAVADSRAASGQVLKGITADPMGRADRNRLQRHGMATTIPVGDKVVPGAMISTAGTSIFHSNHAAQIMRYLEHEEIRLDDEAHQRELFGFANLPPPPAPDFVWRMNDCDIGALERSTGILFELLHWHR